MGYSCTAKASYTLQAIEELLAKRLPAGSPSNGVPGGFFEQGRENGDGAITGTVYVSKDNTSCRKSGSFRINPDGTVARFPRVDAQLLAAAERQSAERYQEYHGGEAVVA